MPKKSLKTPTSRERQAFCEVYQNKCQYCEKQIHADSIELDHIIPQSIFKNINKLISIKNRFSLPNDFEINSYYNLLPCCSKCNKKKSNKTADTVIATGLETAKKNYHTILKKVKKLDREYELNKKSEVTIGFEIDFRDGVTTGPINKGKIIELEEKPIKFLSQDEIYLKLSKDSGGILAVQSIEEYREAINSGYYATNTYSMKSENRFIETNSILYSLKSAKVPQICCFSNHAFFLNKLNFIDASLTDIAIQMQGYFLEYKPRYKNISEFMKKNKKIKIIDTDTGHKKLHLQNLETGMGKVITELLRGDFSGGGYEEILCSVYEYSIEGTIGITHSIILKQNNHDSKLATAELYRALT